MLAHQRGGALDAWRDHVRWQYVVFVHQKAWLDKNLSCPTYLQIPDIFGLFFQLLFYQFLELLWVLVLRFLTLFYADRG